MLDFKKIYFFIILGGLGLQSACVTGPTKVYQSQSLDVKSSVSANLQPLSLDDNTVVLDARSVFDYNLAHIPQSLNMQWSDFSRPGARNKGLLSEDLYKEARRLALKGISPESKVIIVGNGIEGRGEEGRLAWTLMYMGIQDVQFASLKHFPKFPMTNAESPPKKNEKVWKPNLVKSLIVEKEEIRDFINHPMRFETMRSKTVQSKKYIIDVRSSKEYFDRRKNNGDYKYPDINAIHIPWESFFTGEGRPDLQIRQQLLDLGITTESRIIVISNEGVRSGAVSAALYLMGFVNTGNFAGGYKWFFQY